MVSSVGAGIVVSSVIGDISVVGVIRVSVVVDIVLVSGSGLSVVGRSVV